MNTEGASNADSFQIYRQLSTFHPQIIIDIREKKFYHYRNSAQITLFLPRNLPKGIF